MDNYQDEKGMEVFSIEVTNSYGGKEDGLVVRYSSANEKEFGDLGCSTTMVFISPKIVSKKGVVKPKIQKKIVAFVSEFLENYLEEFVEELSEELKKPIKKDE